MHYETGRPIRVGDEVVADGMTGVVVCDFDGREFARGYESWDIPTTDLGQGYKLSSGVMIETVEAGMVHYVQGIGVIEHVLPPA